MIHYEHELPESKIWPVGSKFVKFNIRTEYFALINGVLHAHKGYRYNGDCKEALFTDMFDAGLLPMSLWNAHANEISTSKWKWLKTVTWGRIKRLA